MSTGQSKRTGQKLHIWRLHYSTVTYVNKWIKTINRKLYKQVDNKKQDEYHRRMEIIRLIWIKTSSCEYWRMCGQINKLINHFEICSEGFES